MNEFSDQDSMHGEARPKPGAGSAGALIRQAREGAGMHIAALAVALKVPVRRLEALEADRYDLLPSPVFVRALALSVCRSLKVDPQPVVALLPKTEAQRLTVEGRINEPFRADSQSPATWRSQLTRPGVLAGLLIALAALALYLVPQYLNHRAARAEAASATAPAEPAPTAAPSSAPATAPATAIEAVSNAAALSADPVVTSAAAPAPAPAAPGAANPVSAAAAPLAPMPVPVPVPVAPARHSTPAAR